MANYNLRDYQERTLQELFAWFERNKTGNPIVSAAVGAGKSILIAELCRRVMTNYKDQRIIMLVSSRELLLQNYEKLRSIYPDGNYGLYSASVGKKSPHAKILFATIGSIHNKYMTVGSADLVICDECHLINSKDVGTYRSFIRDLKKLNLNTRVIGFTGTPFRGNGVLITEGDQALFTDIATEVSIRELLDQDFLSPLVLSETITKTDITGVHIDSKTGDFKINELSKAIDRDDVTKAVVSEIIEAGRDRKSWLIFGVDVQHCEHLHDELESRGIHGAVVHGKTPKAQRDRILSQFKAHQLQYVVNCQILTTGFDHAATDLIALVRNTRSPCLFIQMGGRGLRISPGKRDCLWLDFTDSTAILGSIDQIRGRKEPPKGGEAPKKTCPMCEAILHACVALCECGHEFEISEADRLKDIRRKASEAAILSVPEVPTIFQVSSWQCKPHAKLGSPASLQVSYFSSNPVGNLAAITTNSHREWICFDHQGFARRKAESWWLKFGGRLPYPVDVREAIERFSELTKPSEIQLKKEGKYYVITNHYFEQQPTIATAIVAPKPLPEIHHASAETTSDTVSANDVRPSVSSAFSRALSAV